MSTIFEVATRQRGSIYQTSPQAWRDDLMPASFRNAYFHCESNARESGRRIVEHEFPKKDLPYAEDMGRMARSFTIRAYLIVFQREQDSSLFMKDYRIPRDRLIDALEREGPGELQLPTQPKQIVVCTRYRLNEEERFGGYCTMDITFQEYGVDPLLMVAPPDTASVIQGLAAQLRSQVQRTLQPPNPSRGTGLPAEQTNV
jgi:prophage DNA circulation protein